MRQLVGANGEVLLAHSYESYGEVLASVGEGTSSYGFAAEMADSYIKLIYLRSREYSPATGRFLTTDSWQGNYTKPLSLNGWNYVEGNPINFADPSGYLKETEEGDADLILDELKNTYSVLIRKDYGWGPNNVQGYGLCGNKWYEGAWKNLDELKWTKEAIIDTITEMGGGSRSSGENKFKAVMQNKVTIIRWDVTARSLPLHGPITSFAPPAGQIFGDVILPNFTFLHGKEYAKYSIVHELGHVWDRRTSLRLSNELMLYMGTLVCQGMGGCRFDIESGIEPPPGTTKNPYAGVSPMEDWAEAFASTVYQGYWVPSKTISGLGPLRLQFVKDQINALR